MAGLDCNIPDRPWVAVVDLPIGFYGTVSGLLSVAASVGIDQPCRPGVLYPARIHVMAHRGADGGFPGGLFTRQRAFRHHSRNAHCAMDGWLGKDVLAVCRTSRLLDDPVFGGGISLAVPYTFEPITFAKLVVLFIGLPFGAYGVAAGLIGLSWSLALALRLSWQSVRSRTSDPASVVMVSLAGFVVIEAALVAIGREGFGVSGRYTTAAIVFWVALLAATWRMAGRGFFLPLLAATMIMTVPANDPNYEAYWRLHASFLDRVTREVKAGEFKPASMKDLLPAPFVPGAIRRLQALHVGPFRQ